MRRRRLVALPVAHVGPAAPALRASTRRRPPPSGQPLGIRGERREAHHGVVSPRLGHVAQEPPCLSPRA
eukprot:10490867-Lingulodinium_polyedra.AAC.1